LGKKLSINTARFCVYCGQPSLHDKPNDQCAHSYKPPKQYLIPCRALYHDAEWLLYTVDNEIQSVYYDTQDFSDKHSPVGSGGIVLRNPQIIFKSWELKSVDAIIQFLTQEHNLNSNTSLELITLLWHLNDLLIGQSPAWRIEDLYFEDNCPKLPITNKKEILSLVDKFGELSLTTILNYIFLHGKWEAKVQF
jgi:hypothetical protein